jgi:high-affinity nickel-transport protein
MIPVDTLNSMVLRSVFSRIFDTKGFRYISYALSGVAIITAAAASYEVICKSEILPNSSGPILAVVIIALLFGYSYATRRNKIVKQHII